MKYGGRSDEELERHAQRTAPLVLGLEPAGVEEAVGEGCTQAFPKTGGKGKFRGGLGPTVQERMICQRSGKLLSLEAFRRAMPIKDMEGLESPRSLEDLPDSLSGADR